MEDKTLYANTSGILAGVVMTTLNSISFYILGLTSLRYLDFMAILLYGDLPADAFAGILALLLHLGFTGVLGIIFFYLAPALGPKYFIFKGTIFGLAIFFLSYAITMMYQVPHLTHVPVYTAASNLVGAAAFGITLGAMLKRYESRHLDSSRTPQKI